MRDLGAFASGERFAGRYEIERLLKAGGMGAVYVATHAATRRKVAIKLMHPDIVADAEARARFVQEAQVATLIQSQHVVDVIDAGVDEMTGLPFLAMELLQGQELGELLEARGRLPPHEVVGLLAQAARALDRAHAAGIVHRDLKPENLYLSVTPDEPPKVKILDFGIAKMLQGAQATTTKATGTPLYMAPEQTKRGGGIGPATDVWALGLIAYTLIVGRPYWLADDINQLYAEILVEPLESAVARAGRFGLGLPPAFDGWFFRCVNRDPSQRYPSASEAIAMLGMALGVSIDMPPSLPMGHPSHPSHPMIARASAVPTPHSIGAPMRSLPGQVTTGSPHLAASQVAARPPSGNGKLFAAIGAASLLLAVVAVVVARSGASTDEPDEPKPTKHKAKEDAAPVTVPLREKIERLNPFLGIGSAAMQRHEVTREEYAIFLSDLPEGDRAKWRPLSEWSTEKLDDDAKRLPVTWVSFERARRFCKAIDATLPTTEQWSEALDAKYPWGPDWPDDIAGLAIGKGEGAAPVAVETSKSDKTSDGIRDLAGNVQEWTSSVADGLATVRGGSTAMSAEDAKSAITEGLSKFTESGAGTTAKTEAIAGARLGFRCVRGR